MDKCESCNNDAAYILPCSHNVCDICLNNMINDSNNNKLVCQCLGSFTQDEIQRINNNNNNIDIEKCSVHDKSYTHICKCDIIYCDKCIRSCSEPNTYTIEQWKKQTLIKMKNFEVKLYNNIKGLNCIIDMIMNDNNKYMPLIKQIYDTIDTLFIDISHIDNFNKIINDNELPISNIIKRKNTILNKKTVITYRIDKSNIYNVYINTILKHGGNINYSDNILLIRACRDGKLAVVEYLIKHGADIHARNEGALCFAAMNGHLAVVEYLIEHGANIHAKNDLALNGAYECRKFNIVECLISHGANIHARDDYTLQRSSVIWTLLNDNSYL